MRSPDSLAVRIVLTSAFLVLVLVACLSPVHNDTWWHLAYGREMAERGGFAQHDWFSHTAWGQVFPNHHWLGQRVLYSAVRLGGVPLATAFCAAFIVGAWLLIWKLTRGPLVERLLIVVAAAAGSTLIWSVRTQVFTIFLLPAVAWQIVRDRLLWVPALILLWANLHGGVLLGLILLGGSCLSAAFWNRNRLRARVLCFILSAAATLVTPLGLTYWPAIFASLRRSQINRIQEWQDTPLPPEQLLFWGTAGVLVWLAFKARRRLSEPDSLLVLWAIMLLPSGIRTLRNVAPFMLMAAPAITRLLSSPIPQAAVQPRDRRALVFGGLGAIVVGAAVAMLWSKPVAMLGWKPISPAARQAIAACPDPLYNRYADGGPIIWFVPGKRVFLDSRQDQYPTALVQRADLVEASGDYRELFGEFSIACAVLPPSSRVAQALIRDGWHESFRDERWTVLVRPDRAARSGQPVPAP